MLTNILTRGLKINTQFNKSH